MPAEFVEYLFRKGPCIDADTDRNMDLLCHIDYLYDIFHFSYISGIDSQRINAGFHCRNGKPVIKMDICNKRYRNFLSKSF